MPVSLSDISEDLVQIRDRYLVEIRVPRKVDLKKCNPYLLATTSTIADSEDYEVKAKQAASAETKFGRLNHDLFNAVVRQNPDLRLESAKGVDAVVINTRQKKAYLVAIKSGPNWSNSSSWENLKKEFATAKKDFVANRIEYRDFDTSTIVFHAYGATISGGKRSRQHVDWCIYGQLAWVWVTGGNPSFYLDILDVLANHPSEVMAWKERTQESCGNLHLALKSESSKPLLKALFEGLV